MVGSKYLINATNLHVGGGVQVATSLIGELSRFDVLPDNLFIWVSSAVDHNLRELGYNIDRFENYQTVNSYGLKFIFSKMHKKMNDFDKVFTVFGPLYTFNKNFFSIVGFAQPWIIYPDNDVLPLLSVKQKVYLKLKFFFQKFFFKLSNFIFVELEHVATELEKQNIIKSENIQVVRNCISSIYLEQNCWMKLSFDINSDNLKIGFLGRNYTHKNTGILPFVKTILYDKYGINVDFFVTFTNDEWDLCTENFKNNMTNVGSLSVAQCPSFYEEMDAIIFPSLLECFSATPLESMVMGKPLFASDRVFNRDICSSYSFYFDPLSPESAASVIAKYFSDDSFRESISLSEAKEYALSFSNAHERARQYLNCLLEPI
ncbi:glycosyltransferase [Shewanella sp. MF05960]|uniref:glycosyltransferase n=1 Tax=Shewanella sp. MF05960 TaxID=3434874 RepID=UPI003D78FFCD